MLVIKPLDILDEEGDSTLLTSTNITEADETEYNSSNAPFSEGAVVMVTTTANGAGLATHKIYRSTAGSNSEDPTARTKYDSGGTEVFWWEEVSSTNRYKMFDDIPQDQTENADEIDVTITPAAYVNSLALINVSAASFDLIMTETVTGDVWDETYSLVSVAGINDWYKYYYNDIIRDTDYVIFGLPNNSAATINVVIDDLGATAAIGALVPGTVADLGQPLENAEISLTNYSIKTTDENGRAKIEVRGFAKEMSVNVLMDTDDFPLVQRTMIDLLDTAAVWVADEDNFGTIIYGYHVGFDTIISDDLTTIASIEVEGLTQ